MKTKSILLAMALATTLIPSADAIEARIKDITRIAGLEDMPVIGYGIVMGLNGTGDKDLVLTKQTVANLLENFHITVPSADIKSKNVAVVTVTGVAPAFHKAKDKIDIVIASMGDASSLEGGVLMMTPLLDPNGEVYALAQGNVTVGGFSAGKDGAGGNTITKNHVTTAVIPGGATLKQNQTVNFVQNGSLRLLLRQPDFSTADRMASVINKELGGLASAKDAGTIVVRVPQESIDVGQAAAFVAKLEKLNVPIDVPAKIIVNERTGTIVMGGDVHISEAVVAHGNLIVTVKDTQRVAPLMAPGSTIINISSNAPANTIVTDVNTMVKEDKAYLRVLPEMTSVRDLADTLNRMGATPRDLISILEALRRLGALQMEIVSM